MSTFEQWGIILVGFIIIVLFGEKISKYTKKILGDPNWNNIFTGFVIGIIVSIGISWYGNRDKTPYDWCFHLPEDKAFHCADLYYESIELLK